MNRRFIGAVVGTALAVLTACASDGGSASDTPATSAALSTENTNSEFCTTFAAFDSSRVFLHAGEGTIRPELELRIEHIEALHATLPPELEDSRQALDVQLAAAHATLDIYAANGFDADAVTADPAYSDVSDAIGASLQADVVRAIGDTREFCGIEL